MENMKLHITKHAMDRFKQRFRLVFNSEVLDRKDFVEKLFFNSYDDVFRLKMSPGRYNALCVKSGKPIVERTYKDFLKFVGYSNGNRIIITTMWKIK